MKAKKKTAPRKNTALVRRDGPVPAITKLATQIRDLIEAARSHVSVTANLAMVSLYWNIGRIITQDIQKDKKRAEYGAELMEQLAVVLTRDYGQGYSVHNLRDMKRFFDTFVIRQTLAAESALPPIRSTSRTESAVSEICQPLANKLLSAEVLPPESVLSSDRIVVDFREHFRVGWTHYRMLLSIPDPMQRRFYFLDLLFYHRGLRCLVAIDKVAEYLTRLPDKRLFEERLKIYSRLLKDQSR